MKIRNISIYTLSLLAATAGARPTSRANNPLIPRYPACTGGHDDYNQKYDTLWNENPKAREEIQDIVLEKGTLSDEVFCQLLAKYPPKPKPSDEVPPSSEQSHKILKGIGGAMAGLGGIATIWATLKYTEKGQDILKKINDYKSKITSKPLESNEEISLEKISNDSNDEKSLLSVASIDEKSPLSPTSNKEPYSYGESRR